MGSTPEYIDDYLRIIKEELKDRYKLTEEEAAKAVYKSAVRSILTGSNEEMRRYQMHKSIEETALDIYRQYKNIGSRVSSRNGEEEVSKIMHADQGYTSMRSMHKEKVSVLQDIPLMSAAEDKASAESSDDEAETETDNYSDSDSVVVSETEDEAESEVVDNTEEDSSDSDKTSHTEELKGDSASE